MREPRLPGEPARHRRSRWRSRGASDIDALDAALDAADASRCRWPDGFFLATPHHAAIPRDREETFVGIDWSKNTVSTNVRPGSDGPLVVVAVCG